MNVVMKVVVLLLLLNGLATYAVAGDVLVDFEDAALAETNFTGLNQGFFFVDPYGGRGDSGAMTTSWYTRQNYVAQAFDFSQPNAAITVATFFKLALSDPPAYQMGRSYGEVYLVPSASELGGNINKAFVRFGINYPSGGSLTDNIFGGSLAAPGGSFPGFSQDFPPGTFVPGAWYELKATFTNLGGLIGYEITIDEYDADGLLLVKNVVHLNETTADAFGLTSDSEVFAGFAFEASGAEAVDDFSISLPGQTSCEGMVSQEQVDQAVADAVAQAEAAKDLVIQDRDRQIANLQGALAALQVEVKARDSLLAEKEALITRLSQELQELQSRPPYSKRKPHHSGKHRD